MGENWQVPHQMKGSVTCHKSVTWDRRIYFPSEGRHSEDFLPWKIRRLRSGLNPRSWVPEPSMLTTRPLNLLPRWGIEVELYSFVASALEGVGWSAPHPGCFTSRKDPVPIVQEAGWASWPVWTCAINLDSTGIRSLYHPTHSQSLYWLSYPGPFKIRVAWS
jgi:hypothetical protein